MLNRASSMDEYAIIAAMDDAAKLGAAWLRVAVAIQMGMGAEHATASWANGVPFETLKTPLSKVCLRLCKAAVSRQSLGHQTGFISLQTHLRNAFGPIVGATVRWFGEKGKPLAPTKAYQSEGACFVHAERTFAIGDDGSEKMVVSAIGFKGGEPKPDILDPTVRVQEAGPITEDGPNPETPFLGFGLSGRETGMDGAKAPLNAEFLAVRLERAKAKNLIRAAREARVIRKAVKKASRTRLAHKRAEAIMVVDSAPTMEAQAFYFRRLTTLVARSMRS